MRHEILIALDVVDEVGYAAYRYAMAPILAQHGGAFGYDLRVSEVIASPTVAGINRVFTLHFPSGVAKDAFFGDASYAEVRATHFVPSVGEVTVVASYERPDEVVGHM